MRFYVVEDHTLGFEKALERPNLVDRTIGKFAASDLPLWIEGMMRRSSPKRQMPKLWPISEFKRIACVSIAGDKVTKTFQLQNPKLLCALWVTPARLCGEIFASRFLHSSPTDLPTARKASRRHYG